MNGARPSPGRRFFNGPLLGCLIWIFACIGVVTTSADARADEVNGAAIPGATAALPSAPDEPRARVIPLFAVKFLRVQRVAGSIGLGVGREEPKDEWQGLVAVVEPGAGGLTAQAGVGRIVGSYVAWFGRAAFLRTWGQPRGVSARQNYAGAELEAMLLGFNAEVGLYRHIGGPPSEPDWLFNIGAGIWY